MNDDELSQDVKRLQCFVASRKWGAFDDQDEVVGETLLRYWQYIANENRKPIQNRRGWLLKTARNVWRELCRQTHRPDEAVEIDSQILDQAESRPNDLRWSQSKRTAVYAASAWRRLSPIHRHLLQKVIGEGMGVAAAARDLGVKRSTAKSWLSRDITKLSRDLSLRQLVGLDALSHAEGDLS